MDEAFTREFSSDCGGASARVGGEPVILRTFLQGGRRGLRLGYPHVVPPDRWRRGASSGASPQREPRIMAGASSASEDAAPPVFEARVKFWR